MADEQLVAAIATTRRWLESFIAAEYSLQGFQSIRNLRNMFCVSCMEGTLHASDFRVGQPHVGHPYLQVRKHTYRGQVVNADDLTKFIDTECLQPYQANLVFTFSLRARRDVLQMRTPSERRRPSANCNDTLSSDSPLVTVCSVECFLRSESPVTVKPDAPTVMEPPKRRYGPSSLHPQDRRKGKTPGEGEGASKSAEAGQLELGTAEEERVALMPMQQDVGASAEAEENNNGTGGRGGVSSALAENAAENAAAEIIHAAQQSHHIDAAAEINEASIADILASMKHQNIHAAQPPDVDAAENAAAAEIIHHAAQQPDIDAAAEINETSIADVLASMKHQNAF